MSATARRTTMIASAIALAVVGTLVGTHLGGGKPAGLVAPTPTGTPTPANCLATPARAAMPSWYPKDLPLPAGSFATSLPPAVTVPKGYHQGLFVATGALKDFVRHVLDEWTAQGWTLGPGDSERGEAEDSFAKQASRRFGAFRANSSLCDQSKSLVYLVLGTLPSAVVSPTGTGSPIAAP